MAMGCVLGCDDDDVRDRLHARHPILRACGVVSWPCPGCRRRRSSLELVLHGRVPLVCPMCNYPVDERDDLDGPSRLEEA